MQSDPKQIADLTAMNALIERDLLFFSFDQVKTQIFVLDAQSLRMVLQTDPVLMRFKSPCVRSRKGG